MLETKETAENAAPKASAIARSQRIYRREQNATTLSKQKTWLTTSGTGYSN